MSRLRLLSLGLLGLALLAATASCRERSAPMLRVELGAIPQATASLEVRFTLAGRAALAPTSFNAPAGGFPRHCRARSSNRCVRRLRPATARARAIDPRVAAGPAPRRRQRRQRAEAAHRL